MGGLHLSSTIIVYPIIYEIVKVPAQVLYGNYWARGKFEKVM